MKPVQTTGQEKPDPELEDSRANSARGWEDSSGEGAASALESWRKLQRSRAQGQPAEDRPASD